MEEFFQSGITTVETVSFTTSQLPYFEICLYAAHFKVQELQLADNYIKELDTSNGCCLSLRILDVSYNQIKEVSFSQVKYIKTAMDINLSNNNIKAVSFCPYNSSAMEMGFVSLNLSFNFLTSIQQDQFKCLKNLKVLALNDNKIYTIGNGTFSGLAELEILNLGYNQLYMIGEYNFQNLFALKQLNLNENRLSAIDEWAFLDLQQLEEITLSFSNDIDDMFWWYTLYMFYTIKCWLSHKRNTDIQGQYEYDVFVSYNTNDELWVTEQLLPNLENNGPPFFKVCIHNRDFEVGRDIVENIVDSIYKSRWTICLITQSYLDSYWCSLEIRMATYRLVAESKDSLIIIFLDEIPKEKLQYYHKLTNVLNKKTYINWPDNVNGQQMFWARLRKVIYTHVERDQRADVLSCPRAAPIQKEWEPKSATSTPRWCKQILSTLDNWKRESASPFSCIKSGPG
ncbi:uncharacterized protein O3C94_017963 [Discoglossus pictus]